MDCVFCKIVAGTIPCTKVYEDENILAFRDIAPQTPVHILVIPKEHIQSANDINADNATIVADIFKTIPKIATTEGLGAGYRVVTNIGDDGGQVVHHLHFHIMGGTKLSNKLVKD